MFIKGDPPPSIPPKSLPGSHKIAESLDVPETEGSMGSKGTSEDADGMMVLLLVTIAGA